MCETWDKHRFEGPQVETGLFTNHTQRPVTAGKVFEGKAPARLMDASLGSANPGIVIEGVGGTEPAAAGRILRDFEDFLLGNACTLWK